MDNHQRKEGDESHYTLPRIIVAAIVIPIFIIIVCHLLLTAYLRKRENKRRREKGCECFYDPIEFSPFSVPWWRWKDVECGCQMRGKRDGLRVEEGEDGGIGIDAGNWDVKLEDVAERPNEGDEGRDERVANVDPVVDEEIREVIPLPPAYGEIREMPPGYAGPEKMFAHRKEGDG